MESSSARSSSAKLKGTCRYPGCQQPTYQGSEYCSKTHLRKHAKASTHAQDQNPVRPQPAPQASKGNSPGGILSLFGLIRLFWSGPRKSSGTIKFYEKGQPYYEFTNFAPYTIRYNQKDYPTSEHLFQSLKFADEGDAERIRTQSTPRGALEDARKYQHRVRKGWTEQRFNVKAMEIVLLLKFTQYDQLKKLLLDTGDASLVEDSPIDSFWGVGSDGKGGNELGKALEKVRSNLRQFCSI